VPGTRVEVRGASDLDLVMIDCAPDAISVDDCEVALGPGIEGDSLDVCEVDVLEVLDGLNAEIGVEELRTVCELENGPEGDEVGVDPREAGGGGVGRGLGRGHVHRDTGERHIWRR
jgi:hypothetical protein